MAKHNEARLLGLCREVPKIATDETTGEAIRATFNLVCIRGIRDFGENDSGMKLDNVRVFTRNRRLIETISQITPNSIVEIKGSFNTQNITRKYICSYCKEQIKEPGTMSYVNPIFIDIRGKAESERAGVEQIKAKYELSNGVTIIGMLCRDPRMYVTSTGMSISAYQVAVMRKYRVADENTDNTVDFPWVKSYGKIAISDSLALKKGSYVFLDGVIQSKSVKRHCVCPHCGKENEVNELVEEIVPYAVEYLRDHNPIKEITKGVAVSTKQKSERVKSEKYIERDYSEMDFDAGQFIETQLRNANQEEN